jgi:Fe-S-cluster containining protein
MSDERNTNNPGQEEPAELFRGRFNLPAQSPIKPVQLRLDDTIQFQCRKGIACFNECCRNIDITLTPYDIVRLKRQLGLSSKEFVARHTVPFEMDHHGMPGLKLMRKLGSTECTFLTEEGCGVYGDRPAACRYYALGSMAVRKKDASHIEDIYFIVKERHCLGHDEPRRLTVREYRQEQGADLYDEMNRVWRDLIIKKRSTGPTVGRPSERSMQLFDMCSYDMDSFREFIESPGFQDVFDLDAETLNKLYTDEDELLRFSMLFLNQVLFGDKAIPLKEGARERRIAERKEHWDKRREEEIEKHRQHAQDAPYEGR